MNKTQVERWYRRLWTAATKYDGYQQFGYDERTLRVTKPGFIEARDRLLALYRQCPS